MLCGFLPPSSCRTQMSGSGMHFLWQGMAGFPQQSPCRWLLWPCQRNNARSLQRQDSDAFRKRKNRVRVRGVGEQHTLLTPLIITQTCGRMELSKLWVSPFNCCWDIFFVLIVIWVFCCVWFFFNLPILHLKSAAGEDEGTA